MTIDWTKPIRKVGMSAKMRVLCTDRADNGNSTSYLDLYPVLVLNEDTGATYSCRIDGTIRTGETLFCNCVTEYKWECRHTGNYLWASSSYHELLLTTSHWCFTGKTREVTV